MIRPGDKNHDSDIGHVPPVQRNVAVVGRAEVTNPAQPGPGGNDGRVADVFAYNHPGLKKKERSYAYLSAFYEPVCKQTGVHVVDINDLSNPFEVTGSDIPATDGNYVGEGVQVIRIGSRDVLIFQNETCPGETPTGPTGGIDLWDVTNPLAPTVIAQHQGDNADAGPGSANTVHSFYAWHDQADNKTYAVLVDNEEFTDVDIVDISNPGAPVLVNDTLDLVELFGVELLDVTDPTPGNVTLIQETDYEQLDPERLARGHEISPEGNAHQSEMSPDLGFLLATDEDFTPYRQVATLEDGTVVRAGSGSDTPQVTPGNPFSTPDTVFLGRGCDVDGALLTASQTGATTGVVERGSAPSPRRSPTSRTPATAAPSW